VPRLDFHVEAHAVSETATPHSVPHRSFGGPYDGQCHLDGRIICVLPAWSEGSVS
jgi:hypothetical protein